MQYSIGTTYEGNNFAYLKSLLPFVEHIEISPDSHSIKKDNTAVILPESIEQLKWLQQNSDISLLVHGVSLSIGSYDGYSSQYIGLLEELFSQLSIKWHSEHLAYCTVNGEFIGTMLTLPRTTEVLDMICRRIDTIQKRFKVPFLIENVISMLPPPDSRFSEAAFLNKISELTGCGLVLDVYNLQCDAHNFGLNIPEFLNELRMENVYELHVAGGLLDREYNFLMDIHAQTTAEGTIELTKEILAASPKNLQAITYEILEEFIPKVGTENIIAELKKLYQIFSHESATVTN